MSAVRIARREWAAALVVSLSVMALTCLPYLVALSRQSPAWRFGGFVFGVEDGNSYIAKMAQGARGAWLFHLPYTTELHRGALLFTYHLALGRMVGWLRGPTDSLGLHDALVVGYHAARLLSGLFLLLVVYRFLAEFLPRRRQRLLALGLVALGGGLGWLPVLLGRGNLLGSLPIDFYSPEAFTFLALLGLPHIAFSRALLLLGLIAHLRCVSPHAPAGGWRAVEDPRQGAAQWLTPGLAAGACWLALGLVQPLYVLVAWAAVAGHVLALGALALRYRAHAEGSGEEPDAWGPMERAAVSGALAGLLSAPMVVYTFLLFVADPIYRQWGAQNIILSPNPVHYLFGWGVLICIGAFGLRPLLRRQPERGALLAGWLLIVPFLLYAPYNLQRRFAEGVQIPLVALAVLGATAGLACFAGRRRARWAVRALIVLTLPTSLFLLAGATSAAASPAEPIFHPADQMAAYYWLGRNADTGAFVVSSHEFGNALPAYTPMKPLVGHGPETVYLEQKQKMLGEFFSAGTDDLARRALYLSVLFAPYIVYGPHERALGGWDPAEADYLHVVFREREYTIYALR